ncbi:MAG: NYN domain-containing protein, partial [Candidatus Heimdallarchaeaceae archaeon]
MEDNDAAIFWDYENVRLDAQKSNVPMAESLMSYLKTVGHPRVKKVYCNWKNINQAIIQALYSMGFDPIQVSM